MKSGGQVRGEVVSARPKSTNQGEDPPQTSGGRATVAATTTPSLALPAYTGDSARVGGSMPATPTPQTLKMISYGASAPPCSAPALAFPLGAPLGAP